MHQETLEFPLLFTTRSQTLGFSPNLGFRIWSKRSFYLSDTRWWNHVVESFPERDRDREARLVPAADLGGPRTRGFGALQLGRWKRRRGEPRLWDHRELRVQGRTGSLCCRAFEIWIPVLLMILMWFLCFLPDLFWVFFCWDSVRRREGNSTLDIMWCWNGCFLCLLASVRRQILSNVFL